MGNLITFIAKKTTAKGEDSNNKINQDKLKSYFFTEDYQNLKLLNDLEKFDHNKATLFYPGCGADILFPLHYLEKLFPGIKETKFIFVDVDNNLEVIKTVLDEIGVTFSEDKNKIRFYWKNILIDLKFVVADVFEAELPNFDIYFEKAFGIMKRQNENYENNIVKKLNSNGILISDSGFREQKIKKIKVPKILSSYQEMIIGVKN